MANIAIVGGGVAGLSAGIYAQMNGHHATIYERHFKPGGNLTGWDRNGYHIDNCIHWLTGTNPVTKLYRTWKDLGVVGNVNIHRAEKLYTFEKDGQSISLCRDLEQMKQDMLAIAPEDKKEILPFIKAIRASRWVYGITGKDEYVEEGRRPWKYRPAGSAIVAYDEYIKSFWTLYNFENYYRRK